MNVSDGWELKLALNPGLIACDPNEQINGGIFPRKSKKINKLVINRDSKNRFKILPFLIVFFIFIIY